MLPPPDSFSVHDLCLLADVPLRTLRYYIQQGLVDRPEGETRSARYGPRHLEQLLLIRKWSAAGVSLDRIRELLQGEEAPVPERPRRPGSVEVRSHLTIADGIELVIEPSRAGLTPEQLRRLAREIIALHKQITTDTAPDSALE